MVLSKALIISNASSQFFFGGGEEESTTSLMINFKFKSIKSMCINVDEKTN